jgi:hypothetical protein
MRLLGQGPSRPQCRNGCCKKCIECALHGQAYDVGTMPAQTLRHCSSLAQRWHLSRDRSHKRDLCEVADEFALVEKCLLVMADATLYKTVRSLATMRLRDGVST